MFIFKRTGRRLSIAIATGVFLHLLTFCSAFLSVIYKNRLPLTISLQCRYNKILNIGISCVSRYSHQRAPNTPPLCSKVWLKASGSSPSTVLRGNLGSRNKEYGWFRPAAYCWAAWSWRTSENLWRIHGKFFPFIIYLQLVLYVRMYTNMNTLLFWKLWPPTASNMMSDKTICCFKFVCYLKHIFIRFLNQLFTEIWPLPSHFQVKLNPISPADVQRTYSILEKRWQKGNETIYLHFFA